MAKTYEISYTEAWIPKGTYFVRVRIFWLGDDLLTGEYVGRNKWMPHWEGVVKIRKATSMRNLDVWLTKHIEQDILPVEKINHIDLNQLSKLS